MKIQTSTCCLSFPGDWGSNYGSQRCLKGWVFWLVLSIFEVADEKSPILPCPFPA